MGSRARASHTRGLQPLFDAVSHEVTSCSSVHRPAEAQVEAKVPTGPLDTELRPEFFPASTLGLDPLMQRECRALVGESVAGGATVLLSSHLLAEAELICSRIGLIREGHLLRVGTMEQLR